MGLFKSKSKYRVVRETKEGYYDIYHVEESEWFIIPIWSRFRSFDTKKQAFDFITIREKDESVPVREVILEKEDV